MKYRGLAFVLLLLGTVHWLAYRHVPGELRGQTWNLTGHALMAALIGWHAFVYRRSAAVLLSCALVGGWALQVAGCSAWWLVERWPRVPGGDLCSERIALPLGLFGMVAALLLAAHLRRHT